MAEEATVVKACDLEEFEAAKAQEIMNLQEELQQCEEEVIRLGFPILRKVQITIDLGGFETHRSGFKSKEMNPATLAPRILWLSTELLLD
jgi:hypothetical protein